MSFESKNSAKSHTEANSPTNRQIKYARRINWTPSQETETYRTVIENYHFGRIEEVQSTAEVHQKEQKSMDTIPKVLSTDDACSGLSSLGKLFQNSNEIIYNNEPHTTELGTLANIRSDYKCSRSSIENDASKMAKVRPAPRTSESTINKDVCCCIRPARITSFRQDMENFSDFKLKLPDATITSADTESVHVNSSKQSIPMNTVDKHEIETYISNLGIDTCSQTISPDQQKIYLSNPAELHCSACNKTLTNNIYRIPVNGKFNSQQLQSKDAYFVVNTNNNNEDSQIIDHSETTNTTTFTPVFSASNNNDREQNQIQNKKKVCETFNVALINDIMQHNINFPKQSISSNETANKSQQPKAKTTTVQNSLKQRQQELHRYRITVEQKRLELLQTKIEREREEMMREKILFDKELELKESQIKQCNEYRDLL